MHQRERVALRVGEERHSQIVVVPRGDATRRPRERHAAARQLRNRKRDVGTAEIDGACGRISPPPFESATREQPTTTGDPTLIQFVECHRSGALAFRDADRVGAST